MFSDNNKKNTVVSGTTQPNRIESNTSIKGDIVSKDDFRIEGVVEGNLSTQGKVVIGTSGAVKGKIECQNADIQGSFEGEITVAELLNIQATATIVGKVQTTKLAIASGAIFEAQCSMKTKGVESLKPQRDEQRSQEAS